MPTEPALKLHSTPDPEPDALGDPIYAAERVQETAGTRRGHGDFLDVVSPEPLTLSGAARTVEVQETPLLAARGEHHGLPDRRACGRRVE